MNMEGSLLNMSPDRVQAPCSMDVKEFRMLGEIL